VFENKVLRIILGSENDELSEKLGSCTGDYSAMLYGIIFGFHSGVGEYSGLLGCKAWLLG
jgi:hypothetical protein